MRVMKDKAPHGAPCNSCGLCCVDSRCPLGAAVFGPGRNCPGLEKTGPFAYGCGLILHPEKHAPEVAARAGVRAAADAAAFLVGAGLGCDAVFEGEPEDEAWRRKTLVSTPELDQKAEAACRIWGLM